MIPPQSQERVLWSCKEGRSLCLVCHTHQRTNTRTHTHTHAPCSSLRCGGSAPDGKAPSPPVASGPSICEGSGWKRKREHLSVWTPTLDTPCKLSDSHLKLLQPVARPTREVLCPSERTPNRHAWMRDLRHLIQTGHFALLHLTLSHQELHEVPRSVRLRVLLAAGHSGSSVIEAIHRQLQTRTLAGADTRHP